MKQPSSMRSTPSVRSLRSPFPGGRWRCCATAGRAAGGRDSTDGSRLIHTPETWCRIALLFAGASDLDASLLTLRRGMKQRGLVELARSGNLRRQIDDWGGGVEVEGQDAVLVFDDGLGGFLPLSEADLSCEPLSFASAGIIPAPSSLMVMAEGVCVVKQTRRALYRHWLLADGEAAPVRGLLARAARLTTEITLGRGEPGHLAALDEVALELAAQGLAAAWPLGSSLRYYREQWEQPCPARVLPGGALPGAQCRALPPHLSGQHRHPQLHGPPWSRRLSFHHRGHPARQPAAADLWSGLPGALRIRLRSRR